MPQHRAAKRVLHFNGASALTVRQDTAPEQAPWASFLPRPRRGPNGRPWRWAMANRVTRDLFAQMIVPARRVILGAACAAMGVSCGGGRSDMATETANTADPLGATAADAACEGTIALGLPGNPM